MEALDAQIDDAKASGNRKLKKTLKNRYVNPFTYDPISPFYLLHPTPQPAATSPLYKPATPTSLPASKMRTTTRLPTGT
jgi:hypothetical protein